MDIVVLGIARKFTKKQIQKYLASLSTGMHLKGVVNAKSDLPATATNGDEYGINTPTHHFAVWVDAISGSDKWFEFETGGGSGKTYIAKDASIEVDNINNTIGANISATANNAITLKSDGLFVSALAEWIELSGYGTGTEWHDGGTLTEEQKNILLKSDLSYIWMNGMHRLTFRYKDSYNRLATYSSSDDYKTHTIEINTSTLAWRYKHEYLATQADLDKKQNITDENLTTAAKTVVGAINELNTKSTAVDNKTIKLDADNKIETSIGGYVVEGTYENVFENATPSSLALGLNKYIADKTLEANKTYKIKLSLNDQTIDCDGLVQSRDILLCDGTTTLHSDCIEIPSELTNLNYNTYVGYFTHTDTEGNSFTGIGLIFSGSTTPISLDDNNKLSMSKRLTAPVIHFIDGRVIPTDDVTIKINNKNKLEAQDIKANYLTSAIATTEKLTIIDKNGATVVYEPTVVAPMNYGGKVNSWDELPTTGLTNGLVYIHAIEGTQKIYNSKTSSWDGPIAAIITIDSAMSATSINPVANKVVKDYIDTKIDNKTITINSADKFSVPIDNDTLKVNSSGLLYSVSPVAQVDEWTLITEGGKTKTQIGGHYTAPSSEWILNWSGSVAYGSRTGPRITLIPNETVYMEISHSWGSIWSNSWKGNVVVNADGSISVRNLSMMKSESYKPTSFYVGANGNPNVYNYDAGGAMGSVSFTFKIKTNRAAEIEYINTKVIHIDGTTIVNDGDILKAKLPTKTSELTNDGDGTNPFITNQALTEYAKSTDVESAIKGAKDYTDEKKLDSDNKITAINDKIDIAASSTDKLIPESKINAKITSMSARKVYKDALQHMFATHAELTAATKFYDASGAEVTINVNDTTFVQVDEDHDNKKTLYTASAINPVVWGYVMDWTDNEIILNGKSKIGETVSFYAPETSGTNGQLLMSKGANVAPTWANVSDTVLQYYSHNVKMSWSNGQFINIVFIDNTKESYNLATYTTATAAYEAVRASMYALGYNSGDHPCICATNAGSGTIYINSYADTTKIYTWNGSGWQHISGVVNLTDTVVKVGGAKEYYSGSGIAVDSDGKISATQNIKFYSAILTIGETSIDINTDTNYQVIGHSAKNSTTNEEVICDIVYGENKVTVSIKEAVTYDINILITAANSAENTIVLACPFPVGAVYTSIGEANPSTIWSGTTWNQLADGQFLMNTTDNSLLNTAVAEQLPNIKAEMVEFVIGNHTAANGAFKAIWNTGGACSYNGSGDWKNGRFTFDASNCNAAYTDDGVVRPASLACKMWIRIS